MLRQLIRKIRSRKIANGYITFFVLAAIFLLLLPHIIYAQGVNVGVEYGENIGLGNLDPRVMAVNIIRVALGFLAIIVVMLIIFAGWMWMMSGGDPAKIDKAKKILKNAVIGLAIILASFGITTFLIRMLGGGITTGPGPGPPPGPGGGGIPALGSGIIESHYPARNQRDVPRNTSIVVAFKELMDSTTIISGALINPDNILIYKTVDGAGGPFVTDVAAQTVDNKTFVFRPNQYLGSPSEKIWYSVALGTGISKANGDAAFPGAVGGIGYDWSFEVGTFIDDTPPRVTSIIPQPDAVEPRNVVIQINFSEAVDPISASGDTGSGFDNIEINGGGIDGIFYISNQYRTVEFLTNDACGVNSCNETVYCLPASATMRTLAKAARLIIIDEPTAVFPYNGIVDMAGNSLDGNKNNIAEGPESQNGQPPYNENAPDPLTQGDDYEWSFDTNDAIDISAPVILTINPSIFEAGVNLDAIPEAIFSKLLMSSSLNTTNIELTTLAGPMNYWIGKSDDMVNKRTTVKIYHEQFTEDTDYTPRFNQGIKDIYQNCYSPSSGAGCTGGPSCCGGVTSGGASCP